VGALAVVLARLDVSLFDDVVTEPPAPSGPTVRVRMVLAYDGAGFHGFAPQPGGVRTVAGVLADVLERVLRLAAPPAITCAGRTDVGVHAWGQVAHVDLPATAAITSPGGRADLHRRLVRLLAPEVVVRSLETAPAGWDARRSALARSYRYTVLNRPLPDPFRHGQVWLIEPPLDVRAMQLACDPLIGEHDFSSFCRKAAADGPPDALVRRVLAADWRDLAEGELRFEISANAFCQQMVRSVVGTLVEVGLGKRRAGEIAAVLRARDRSSAGAVAPPEGLCLWEVTYPPS
jgi:tRNA pseudouridine38-40 synthase